MQPWPPNQECNWEHYSEFKQLLDRASYHFADDSGSEWGQARQCVDDAARLVAARRVPFWAIQRMVADARSLVMLDDFMQRQIGRASCRERV